MAGCWPPTHRKSRVVADDTLHWGRHHVGTSLAGAGRRSSVELFCLLVRYLPVLITPRWKRPYLIRAARLASHMPLRGCTVLSGVLGSHTEVMAGSCLP